MKLLAASILLALAAYWLAIGIGIPSWRDYEPGDAADIGVCVFVAVMLLGSRR